MKERQWTRKKVDRPRTELVVMLESLGMSKMDLCRELSIKKGTVYRWKDAPKHVIAYLELKVRYEAEVTHSLAERDGGLPGGPVPAGGVDDDQPQEV